MRGGRITGERLTMRVFITGATGLIGSHVAERLRARGDAVTALVRPSSDTAHLESLGCDLARGDLGDPPEGLATAMRGCDAVIHAAARVFRGGSRQSFLRENVDGTVAVLTAASLAAPRVVHLSSVAVYAGLPLDRPLTEDRWTEADPERQNAYAASKHLAERAAWQLAEAGAIRLTTVRPAVVYGERDRAATPIMVRYATLPLVPLLGGGDTTLPLLYAGNVARAIVAALDRPAGEGRGYNLGMDQPVTARQMVATIRREMGRPTRRRMVTVPAVVPRSLAGFLDVVGGLVPVAGRTGFIRAARSLVTDNPYDSTRARLELGWRGAITHEEGLRRTLGWWRGRNLRTASPGR